MAQRDEVEAEIDRLMADRDWANPDDVFDALGLLLLTHPTNVSKDTIAEIVGAMRAEIKESREGEEWKGGTDD